MKTVSTPITVEWGDCDPAGIVFYPRFFAWFDASAWNLFYAVGLTLQIMREQYRAVGFPALDVQATFHYPCRLKEPLTVVSAVSEWSERTFTISHTVRNGEIEAVTGREVRIWGIQHPEDPKRLKAAPIPPDVRALLGG
jgi:4-hydroxybenzoyl-CoA thioesterase